MRRALTAIAICCLALAPPAGAAADEGYELYLRGEFDRAGEVFRRAAERGDPAAQYMLGTLYALGQGVKRDATKAHRWLSLAADQGDPLARLLLVTVAGGAGALSERAAESEEPRVPPDVAVAVARRTTSPVAEAKAKSVPQAASVPEADSAPRSEVVMASLPPPAPAERFRTPFEDGAGATTAIAPDPALDRKLSGLHAAAPDVPAPAAAGRASTPVPSPATVTSIQRRLAALGYSPGPADGAAGARTRIAIRAFQRDTGLEIDGVPSPALDAALAVAAGEGGLVAGIQERLGRLGFAAGPADGVLRDATRRAMLDYYRAAGVTGVLALDELARRLDADLAAAPATVAAVAGSGPAPRRLAEWIAPLDGGGAAASP